MAFLDPSQPTAQDKRAQQPQQTQQDAVDMACIESAAAGELCVFHDTYHWHSGLPIEPSYIGETHEANILAQYRTADAYQMAQCLRLSQWQRRKLQKILSQQADPVLRHSDARERSKILSRAAEMVRGWLKDNSERMIQLNARFLHKYAETMNATKYCMPDPAAIKSGRKTGKKQGIIDAHTATQKAKSEADRTQQWSQLHKELQQYGQTHRDCRDTHMADRVIAFIKDCSSKPTSAATFLSACLFHLQGELLAWKQQCRSYSSSPHGLKLPAVQRDIAINMSHAVAVWQAVQNILDSGQLKAPPPVAKAPKGSTKAASDTAKVVKQAAKECKQAMELVGFTHVADSLSSLLASLASQKPAKDGSKPLPSPVAPSAIYVATTPRTTEKLCAPSSAAIVKPFDVGLSESEFQLRFCGDQLRRSIPPVPDPRVSSFTPDAWQLKVLDAIDARESAVICAPTSSGKTFISSFCMDRVLRSSKDGIVVFVAPTKALVNQTAAQVKKDFGPVVGVFTRDYRDNEEKARILVTVPACLEILLFSTTKSHRDWVKRLRYVIFDEVHCMREGGIRESGAAETSGAIWEHCLLLIRCPLLALSATIGNPEQVTGWLQDVKLLQQQQDQANGLQVSKNLSSISYKVRLIQHTERYADLRYHRYMPAVKQADYLEAVNYTLQKLHPFAVLDSQQIKHAGFPADLTLEPADCLDLFNSMQAVLNEHKLTATSQVSQMPDSAGQPVATSKASFDGTSPATQAEATSASGVSDMHTRLAAANHEACGSTANLDLANLSPSIYFPSGKAIMRSQVRNWEAELKGVLQSWATDGTLIGNIAVDKVLQHIKARSDWESAQTAAAIVQPKVTTDDFMDMLKSLEGQGMLPSLAFSFDRRHCERLAAGLTSILERDEAQKRSDQPVDEHKLRSAARQAEKAAKASRDKKATRRDAQDAQAETVAGFEGLDEDEIDPAFSFAGQRLKSMSKAEVQDYIDLGTRSMDADSPLKQALRRGIGVHHSGLPTKYRQVVEILFRCGHLQVVIATGTLAYGINMPCRTVIFVGDHIFLNALQFRQMSGRAGRRGFDTLGHVIFMHVPQRKVASLMISPMPQLHGNFPLTVTLALRVLTLQKEADQHPAITGDLLRLLQKPFFASEDASFGQKMQHLFSYALMYLRQQVMLNSTGQACEFAGMASHLFWAEPSNYAFVTLLRKGVFHSMCQHVENLGLVHQGGASVPEDIADQVLLVMSHLFERVLLTRSAKQDEAIKASPSRVVLERLSPEVEAIIAEHNTEALNSLLSYVSGYITANIAVLPPDNVLPLSGLSYPMPHVQTLSPSDPVQQGVVSGALLEHHKEVVIVSPFVALSGQGEDFRTAEQVVQCVRPGVLLSAATIPSVRTTDASGQQVLLNRYVLDYWKHGQRRALQEANGMREGDAWQHLKSFVSILSAIATAMTKMVEGTTAETDPVVWTFEQLAAEFKEKHKMFNSARK